MIAGSVDCSSVIVKNISKAYTDLVNANAAPHLFPLTRSLLYFDEHIMNTEWIAYWNGSVTNHSGRVYLMRINNMVIVNPLNSFWSFTMYNTASVEGYAGTGQLNMDFPSQFRPSAEHVFFSVSVSENTRYDALFRITTGGRLVGPTGLGGIASVLPSGSSGTRYFFSGPLIYYTNAT